VTDKAVSAEQPSHPQTAPQATPSEGCGAWVSQLWPKLADQIQHPVRVVETPTGRLVEMMGISTYEIDYAQKRVQLSVRGEPEPHSIFDLIQPVRLWMWLEKWVDAQDVPADLLAAVVAELKGRLRKITSLRQLAAQVRAGLDIEDHPALAIALRSRTWLQTTPLMACNFNRVWQHLSAYQLVEQENPQLLPVFALADWSGELPFEEDPVSELKRALINRGITQAGWRLLVSMGYHGVRPALERFGNPEPLDIVVGYCQSLAKVGVRTEPNRTFMRAWLNDIEPDMRMYPQWHQHPAHTLRAAFKALSTCKTAEAIEAFTREFLMVDQWVQSKPIFDDNQKKIAWKGLVARARTHEILKGIEMESQTLMLPCTIQPFEIEGLIVVPISTSYDLYLEGAALRHCAYMRLQACLQGASCLFSIRQADTDKRLATVECARNGYGWALSDVRGFGNRRITGGLRKIAKMTAKKLNQLNPITPHGYQESRQRQSENIQCHPTFGMVQKPAGRGKPVPDFQDDTESGYFTDDDDDVDSVDAAMSAIVAQAHGEGEASTQDWQLAEDHLSNNHDDYAVNYCLLLTEDLLPDDEGLIEYLEDPVDHERHTDHCNNPPSATADELNQARQCWIQHMIYNHDSDEIYSAAILEIKDGTGRTAYLRADVGGYSFTQFIFYLVKLYQHKEDAIADIRDEVLPEIFGEMIVK
jgi:hypothetical protein